MTLANNLLLLIVSTTLWPAVVQAVIPRLPVTLPVADTDGVIRLTVAGNRLATTIDVALQNHLQRFIRQRGNPISSLVMVEVASGKILALVQGKNPQSWGGDLHSALFAKFPAASLFKTVTAGAYLELLRTDTPLGFSGSCGEVEPSSVWLRGNSRRKFTLKRAYALSCNGYFADIAVKYLGLGALNNFAERFRFGKQVPADFFIPSSQITRPQAAASSTHSVGQYAAGLGRVTTSAVHAAWLHLLIANNGRQPRLRLFRNSSRRSASSRQVISVATSEKLQTIMRATVNGGTASYAFRSAKYRRLRKQVGGKTGTLYSRANGGITTWFAGQMPITNPQVVIAAIVVIPNNWIIKGPNLAAEGFWAYLHRKSHSSS